MRLMRRIACLTAAAACGLVMAGCQTGEPAIVNGQAALPEQENSAAFLDRISSLPNVSENDAMRGVLMLLDGKDEATNFAERVEKLRVRRIIGDWDCDAGRPISKGKYAYMIYQATKLPGGVTLTVIGPTQRYCLRELQYREVMSEGWIFSKVTGMEYVAVLGRADVYARTGRLPDKSGDVEIR